jgi:hypothetical protein
MSRCIPQTSEEFVVLNCDKKCVKPGELYKSRVVYVAVWVSVVMNN